MLKWRKGSFRRVFLLLRMALSQALIHSSSNTLNQYPQRSNSRSNKIAYKPWMMSFTRINLIWWDISLCSNPSISRRCPQLKLRTASIIGTMKARMEHRMILKDLSWIDRTHYRSQDQALWIEEIHQQQYFI
jgi:hypothetical protein